MISIDVISVIVTLAVCLAIALATILVIGYAAKQLSKVCKDMANELEK